ncbi:MAG: sulfatase [Opitutales bacterium]
MSCADRPEVRTPHLDRLATRGVRFERAYCNNPICGPSRCSMISGQYPHTTGITGNFLHECDIPAPQTLPIVLRDLGYQTMMVGKAHMIRQWNEAGFEQLRYTDLIDADDGDLRNVHYYKYLIDQGLADAYDLGARLEGQTGHQLERFISDIPLEHNIETWSGDQAVQLLQERDRNRPFMMQLSFQRPHEPLCIPPECADWYDPASLTLPESIGDYFDQRFEGKPKFQRNYIRGGTMGYPYRPRDEDDLRGQLAYYYTLITLIDQQIGRVLNELEAEGELDNTVIAYVADHGDFAGEHGLILKNLGIYESIHRTPFIVSYPDGPRSQARDAMVELVDLYPTLLDAAGLGEHLTTSVEGMSRLPEARGERNGLEHTVCEFDFNNRQPYSVAVRSRTHRLVLYPEQAEEIGELYDHRNDPGELNNLWEQAEHRDIRLDLTERALCFISRYPRRWSFSNDSAPPYRSNGYRLVLRDGCKWSDPVVQNAHSPS